jgi:nitroimidazol reductase NimA-like FMN-containing flavoprotein (pyridoxamine 5'-phosphate oxidase superfamily)
MAPFSPRGDGLLPVSMRPEPPRRPCAMDLSLSRYMTIATSSEDGTPWVTPVWFAPDGDDALLWVSDPQARHSRNISVRPQIAIVVFDSTVVPYTAEAVYLTAAAAQVADGDVQRCIDAFSRHGVAQGLRPWVVAEVTGPARHRLYRAALAERWELGPGDQRIPLAR